MKDLLVDGRSVGPHGIGRFTWHILEYLPEAEVIRSGGHPNRALDPMWLRRELGRRKPDLFFTPSFVVPLASPVPVIPTLHDLIHLQIPVESNLLQRSYYRRVLLPTVRKAAVVLTVSEVSKRAIVEWSGLRPEAVAVVGNGVAPPFEPGGSCADPGAPFVLMVGAARPHKNGLRALAAFASSRASEDHLLYIRDRQDPALVEAAREAGILEKLVFLPPLDDEELARWYRGASCLLMPSLVEGFGLPALESLACGTVVVGSKGGAIEEVVGDAAVLVDQHDVADIAAGVDAAVEHRDPALVARGIERAGRFSWSAVGAKVRAALVEV